MSLDVPLWDGKIELLHEHFEDDLASSEDTESGHFVHWSGLEVDNDEITTSLSA